MGENSKSDEAEWLPFYRIIRERFPFCKVKDVRIQGGKVVRYGKIQFTKVFNGDEAAACTAAGIQSDAQWQRFIRFCRAIQDGSLAELHFADGRPILVSMEHSGEELALSALPAALCGNGPRGGDATASKQLVLG